MIAIDAALKSLLSGDPQLSALATGGVWRAVAPAGTPEPYCTFQQVGSDEFYAFSPFPYAISTAYRLSGICAGESHAVAGQIAERARALLLSSPPAPTGLTCRGVWVDGSDHSWRMGQDGVIRWIVSYTFRLLFTPNT